MAPRRNPARPASGTFVPAGYGQPARGSAPAPAQTGPSEAELAAWYAGVAGASQPSGAAPAPFSGTAGTAAPSVDTDPGFLEFSRQTDLSIARATADLTRRRGLIEADRDRVLGDLVPQGKQQREGIAAGFESRVLFGSGAMERDVARQYAAQAQREAGIQAGAAGQISDIDADEDWQHVLDVDLKGPFLCMRAAIEHAPDNVRVNLLAPSATDTGLFMKFSAMAPDPEKLGAQIAATNPMQRIGRGEEVCDLVAFLASDRSTYLSGSVIPLDGGMAVRRIV